MKRIVLALLCMVSVASGVNEWHSSTTTNHFENFCKVRKITFSSKGDVEAIERFLPDQSAATADTLVVAYTNIATIVSPKADGQTYAGTWIHVNTYMEFQPDGGRTVSQDLMLEGGTTDADARLLQAKFTPRENTDSGEGGDVDLLIRYWPRLTLATAQTKMEALEGPTDVMENNPVIEGQTFTGEFVNSFCGIRKEGDGTYRVEQVLTDPNEPDADGTPDQDGTGYDIVRLQYDEGNLVASTKEWKQVSDATALTIMGSPATYNDGVGTLDLADAARVNHEDGTSTVRSRFTDQDGGAGDIFTRDIRRRYVEKQADRSAIDGFRWRVIEEDISVKYTTSAANAENHADDGLSGSFSKIIRRGYYYAEQVKTRALFGDGNDASGTSWQYKEWPTYEAPGP
jgi:hypothetical protein